MEHNTQIKISSPTDDEESESPPILCISDLHGNLRLLQKALKEGLKRAKRDDLCVVLLGDFCDNGTEVRELLEYLSTEQWRETYPYITLHCIAGNHDVALVLAHSPDEFHNNPDPKANRRGSWWDRSTDKFCINSEGTTIKQYNAQNHTEFVKNFPRHHFEFLRALPWSLSIAHYIFVHAGLRLASEESVASQIQFLAKRDLSDLRRHVYARGGYGLPDQLCNKEWACLNDPAWERVVVTGHNKYSHRDRHRDRDRGRDRGRGRRGGGGGVHDVPDFVASHRIGFHSCACQLLLHPEVSLHCALLPTSSSSCSLPFPTTDEAPPRFFSVTHWEGQEQQEEQQQEKQCDVEAPGLHTTIISTLSSTSTAENNNSSRNAGDGTHRPRHTASQKDDDDADVLG